MYGCVGVQLMLTPLWLKRLLIPVAFRYPRSRLQAERLYIAMKSISETAHLGGDILEVGCYQCGTAEILLEYAINTDAGRRYVGIDTFSGFVRGHFESDCRAGLARQVRYNFASNSKGFVQALLRYHGVSGIELVQGDICSLDLSAITKGVSFCLMDVDLEVPTYMGLRKVWELLECGGITLVDDCIQGSGWVGARRGFHAFVKEYGLPETIMNGLGVLRKPA